MTTIAPLFELGSITPTTAALKAVSWHCMQAYLKRHARGDWGCIDSERRASNAAALAAGLPVISAYPIYPANPCNGHDANTVAIMTVGDRSRTKVFLPLKP